MDKGVYITYISHLAKLPTIVRKGTNGRSTARTARQSQSQRPRFLISLPHQPRGLRRDVPLAARCSRSPYLRTSHESCMCDRQDQPGIPQPYTSSMSHDTLQAVPHRRLSDQRCYNQVTARADLSTNSRGYAGSFSRSAGSAAESCSVSWRLWLAPSPWPSCMSVVNMVVSTIHRVSSCATN